jgi:uncharacterized UPF0160 family protein
MEESISMPELVAILEAKNNQDYEDRKFLAALQGVNIDESSSSGNKWEEMKARVYSKGVTSNPNDILALQGAAAKRAGFGIGQGLEYEVIS